MELVYEYTNNKFTDAHQMNVCNAVRSQSQYLKDELRFPVAGQPLALVQQYAHMTTMLTITRDLIFQRHNNLIRSPYWEDQKKYVFSADALRMHLFQLKQEFKYLQFISVFRELMIPALKRISPHKASRFYTKVNEKVFYLYNLCNYDCTKTNAND